MVVTSPALPGERFTTEILAIDPILDPMTRTTRVRGLVSTPDATLRPESFVDVMIHVPLGEQLAVPEDAVLDTGEHQLVFAVRTMGRSSHVPSSSGAKRKATTRCGRAFPRASRSSRRRTSSSTRNRAFGPRSRPTNARQRQSAEVTRPMVERIIEFSAKNRGLVLLLTAVAVLGAVWTTKHIPLDAIPDLSDTQVIIYSRWDRSPDILEDQVTYPIVTALLGAPRIKAIRGFSDFGFSYVYVIFEDGTDLYWARSRVLEYLTKILSRLPEGVRTELGPGRDERRLGLPVRARRPLGHAVDSRELRSLQDWYLRYPLQSVPGRRRGRGRRRLREAVPGQRRPEPRFSPTGSRSTTSSRRSARATTRSAAGSSSLPGREYMVRGRGYVGSLEDIEKIVVGEDDEDGHAGAREARRAGRARARDPPRRRRPRRHGRHRRRHHRDAPGRERARRHRPREGEARRRSRRRFPQAWRSSRPTIARSSSSAPSTRSSTSSSRRCSSSALVILVFLWHIPSAIVPIVTIPISVLLAFIPMYFMGLTSTSCRSPASRSPSACSSTARSSRSRTPTSSSRSGTRAAGRATSTRCAWRRSRRSGRRSSSRCSSSPSRSCRSSRSSIRRAGSSSRWRTPRTSRWRSRRSSRSRSTRRCGCCSRAWTVRSARAGCAAS